MNFLSFSSPAFETFASVLRLKEIIVQPFKDTITTALCSCFSKMKPVLRNWSRLPVAQAVEVVHVRDLEIYRNWLVLNALLSGWLKISFSHLTPEDKTLLCSSFVSPRFLWSCSVVWKFQKGKGDRANLWYLEKRWSFHMSLLQWKTTGPSFIINSLV